jgi:hypothetical protein
MTAYADLTNLVEILKNVYGDGLRNQFKDEKTTYNQFPTSDRKPQGLGYIFGIRYARTQSTGARAESAKLPDPFTGVKDQGKIVPRYIYGAIRLTGPAMETAKANVGAFVDGLADEMDDIYQSIIVDLNRQCHWDGFGKVASNSASFAPSTSTTYAVTFDNDIGIMYLQEGGLYDWYDSTGATPSTSCVAQRILNITPSTKVVVFETSGQTYIANHPNSTIAGYTNAQTAIPVSGILVKMGARDTAWATTDTPVEITGLDGIYDDATTLATFENITVASNPKWAANLITNSGVNRELSIDLMLNAVDLTRIRSGMNVSTIRMGLGQRRKYANLLMPDVRFLPTILKGGFETLTFSGGDGSVSMVIDAMTQPNKIYFEPSGIIMKYELTPLGWGDLDGSKMHRVAGYDMYDLFIRIYTNLGCEQRNCLTVVKDLVEPSLY